MGAADVVKRRLYESQRCLDFVDHIREEHHLLVQYLLVALLLQCLLFLLFPFHNSLAGKHNDAGDKSRCRKKIERQCPP